MLVIVNALGLELNQIFLIYTYQNLKKEIKSLLKLISFKVTPDTNLQIILQNSVPVA